jgi:hypothetical protein
MLHPEPLRSFVSMLCLLCCFQLQKHNRRNPQSSQVASPRATRRPFTIAINHVSFDRLDSYGLELKFLRPSLSYFPRRRAGCLNALSRPLHENVSKWRCSRCGVEWSCKVSRPRARSTIPEHKIWSLESYSMSRYADCLVSTRPGNIQRFGKCWFLYLNAQLKERKLSDQYAGTKIPHSTTARENVNPAIDGYDQVITAKLSKSPRQGQP